MGSTGTASSAELEPSLAKERDGSRECDNGAHALQSTRRVAVNGANGWMITLSEGVALGLRLGVLIAVVMNQSVAHAAAARMCQRGMVP